MRPAELKFIIHCASQNASLRMCSHSHTARELRMQQYANLKIKIYVIPAQIYIPTKIRLGIFFAKLSNGVIARIS
jgi:hypothetical protein